MFQASPEVFFLLSLQEGAASKEQLLFACPHCPWLFYDESHCLVHMLNHTTGGTEVCDKQINEEPKDLHLTISPEEESYVSETQNNTFEMKDKNFEHLVTRIKEEPLDTCDIKFKTQNKTFDTKDKNIEHLFTRIKKEPLDACDIKLDQNEHLDITTEYFTNDKGEKFYAFQIFEESEVCDKQIDDEKEIQRA